MVQTVFPAKCDFPPFDEQAIKLIISDVDGRPQAKLVVYSYMYPVYEAAIRFYKMLSEQGYNLIVDEVLFDANRVTPYFEIPYDNDCQLTPQMSG
jgi:chloramphenicol 3-O phosphotransferase